ncbi:MAG: hypothetical protein WBE37_33665 [Bryobacteraceae bacterium]
MVFKILFWRALICLMAAGGLSLAAFGKNAPPREAVVPADPLEMAAGHIETVNAPAKRAAVVQLLAHARDSYALRNSGRGYDLKVSFTVNSGGETQYDGQWEMEDTFDPQQGLRWTASTAAGYTTTQISTNGMFYREGTSSTIPLRLQEARAALFDPIPPVPLLERDVIRTSASTYNGTPVTCVLLSRSGNAASRAPGRSWEETEECVDPQSGLLRVHSQVPGRYYAYDYTNAPQFSGHMFPRKVAITEGGQTVTEITVNSLADLPAADANLFVPTEEMRAAGPAVAMAGAQKIWFFSGRGPFPSGATAHPVCVFGLVTASGQLVEAHSLQPSDPNSAAAVQAAQRMNFSYPAPPGARPEQHFVFIIDKFVSSQ